MNSFFVNFKYQNMNGLLVFVYVGTPLLVILILISMLFYAVWKDIHLTMEDLSDDQYTDFEQKINLNNIPDN